jgi:hypothetical protein
MTSIRLLHVWHHSGILREAAGTKEDESKGDQYLHELAGLEFLRIV